MGEQVEPGAAAHVEHAGPTALHDPHHRGLLQPLQGLAHRVPVHGEGGGQLALGRQQVPRRDAAREDRVAQLREHLVGDRAARDRSKPRVSHALQSRASRSSGQGLDQSPRGDPRPPCSLLRRRNRRPTSRWPASEPSGEPGARPPGRCALIALCDQ